MDAKEATLYTSLIITAFILGSIILYFFVSIIRQQQKNAAQQRRQIVAEISTLENERTRISRDLHDELGPLLSVIKFQIDAVSSTNEEDKGLLQQASAHIDEVVTSIRRIASNLMPTALLRKNLVAALNEFISSIEASSTLKIRLMDHLHTPLEPEQNIHIYRIIQEIVHNAVKHANATYLLIRMKEEKDFLYISCQDDGIGFHPEKKDQSKGQGLRNMQSRTEMMNGKMYIQSYKREGTHYLFEIPLKKSHAAPYKSHNSR